MSRISDECPDCGANYMVMGFACSHERCPIFAEETEACRVCGNEERGQGGYLTCQCPALSHLPYVLQPNGDAE